jgi:hypothetical protein
LARLRNHHFYFTANSASAIAEMLSIATIPKTVGTTKSVKATP